MEIIYCSHKSPNTELLSNIKTTGDTNDKINCIDFCSTWVNAIIRLGILSQLSEDGTLLLIDSSMLKETDVTLEETLSMISTFNRCIKSGKIKFAVIVDETCNKAFIKKLQSTDILGIIPCLDNFPRECQKDSIQNLLNGHSNWPKDVLNHICDKQKVTKTKHAGIHLTDRQTQVLDLVCNRGLSNKKLQIY